MAPFHLTATEATAALPAPSADQLRYVTLLQHGSMAVELYAPVGEDRQTPHDQDELYVIVAGHGEFRTNEE